MAWGDGMGGVLITRPEPGASQTARKVAELGLTPIVAPVLAITPTGQPVEVPAACVATVLTSGNAAPACPPACHANPAFAVGSATARRAREAGFTRVVDADADAAALPDLIAATIGARGQTLFLPVGRGQGAPLSMALRDRGWRVVRRVAYQADGVATLPEAAVLALHRRTVRFALFFSAETARQFIRLVRKAGVAETLSTVEAVSISERTAMALRRLPWRRVRTALRPNQDAMLELLR
ncbi:MAG TPA: uroporphyrinogen-III synthase [Rhodopila sp.]|uniref:uroporphyrinogen-III synthase n=1 Tax=Rhodopila sp. TaxID=2480087 RepID=UPI002CA86EF9|nr:uroporphyrinogen-III synthase [Rhodopila sp.]HVY16282.1 uroporphyrinogen-III synthase [Rhodopila sp.]